MPEYLAPGVYVEETSFRSKSIEGVSTTTTAFIGPTRYGPIDMQPDIVTSLGAFERVYGDGQQLDFEGGQRLHNYVWHAARAFFEEGGRRLYIARTFQRLTQPVPGLAMDGRAWVRLPLAATSDDDAILVKARFPGTAGNTRVGFRLSFGGNVLSVGDKPGGIGSGVLRGLSNHDVVLVFSPVAPNPAGPAPSAETIKVRDALREMAKSDKAGAEALAAHEVEVASDRAEDQRGRAENAAQALADLKALVRAYTRDQELAIAAVAAAELARVAAAAALVEANDAKVAADAALAALPAGATDAEKAAAAAAVARTTAAAAAAQVRDAQAAQAVIDTKAALKVIDDAPDNGLLQRAQKAVAATQPIADDAQTSADAAAAKALEIRTALREFTGTAGDTVVGQLYRAWRNTDTLKWEFFDRHDVKAMSESELDPDPGEGNKVCIVTATVTVQGTPSRPQQQWSGLPLDPRHAVAGDTDGLLARLGERPGSLAAARSLPISIVPGKNLVDANDAPKLNGLQLASLLFDANPQVDGSTGFSKYPPLPVDSAMFALVGGNDGSRPGVSAYEGSDEDISKTGLKLLEDVEDISIVAAPGVTYNMESPSWRPSAQAINGKLLAHCEKLRYRVAVLDSGNGQTVSEVRSMRAKIDSAHGHAALYYPWVHVLDPITRQEIDLPPSGFVAGIYARNDIDRAVYKAPANEVVRGAIGFEVLLNKAQQEVLNPEGINCFRYFEGRGFRLWGARTVSSDPEWKYVNVRRYFGYLERSIDKGTQWAVFEPNGEALWANVRRTIEDFLLNEWQTGALLGDKPEKAYFVRCDRSTMTQNDLDNGRLICLIGVAALKPAEFVIFRIGQWTADRKA